MQHWLLNVEQSPNCMESLHTKDVLISQDCRYVYATVTPAAVQVLV